MKSIVIALIAVSASFNASAEEQKRSDRTDNKIVVAVGKCTISTKYDSFNQRDVFEATLPSTICQEYKNYSANVTGSFWNQTVTPIPGTETYTYKLENDTEINTTDATNPDGTPNAFGYLNALNQCNSKRKLLNQLRDAQKGKAKCSL